MPANQKEHIHDSGGERCEACVVDIFEEKRPFWQERAVLVIAVSSVLLFTGLYLDFFTSYTVPAMVLFIAVFIVPGYSIAREGLSSLLKFRLDINVLVIVAAVGAFFIGHPQEGASVAYLFFIVEFLEEYAGERAKRSIEALVRHAPETAAVRRNGTEQSVHVHSVEEGEIVLVRPGDKVPLDGVVVLGESSVNQAAITGEPLPVRKSVGDTVYAGTLNEQGYLEVRVTARAEHTVYARIVRLVGEAEKRKSRTETVVARFSRWYTPAMLVLALLIVAVPVLVLGLPLVEWVYRALVILVISCPCALAISTPVSMISGLTAGARGGVLIKGGNFLEEMAVADTIVFDKTGTLTKGKPSVMGVTAFRGCTDDDVLGIAASLEALSGHPLAGAVVEAAREAGASLLPVTAFESIPGKGVRGEVNDTLYVAGSPALFAELGITYPESPVRSAEERGETVILFGTTECNGIITLADRVKPGAAGAVAALKERGLRTVMLTGDNERSAVAVTRELGIEEYHAGLLPEDKVRVIEGIPGKVVMVGDGVNDAPALARANVGVVMGAMGSDAALEVADVALMHDDLSKLVYFRDLSCRTRSIVRENIAVSVGVKAAFVVLAVAGFVTLWEAVGIGDMGLSLLVIVNAIRISGLKPTGWQ